ncbi:MAG: restriction endonuclease subunit S [Candidatus Omnitrophota bacterium]
MDKIKQKNIPDGWQVKSLAKLGSFFKGMGISKADLSESGCYAVRYGELYTKHNYKIKKIYSFIKKDVISYAKKIRKGDILFAGSGETIDEIGKSAVYLFDEICYAGGDTIVFTPKEDDGLYLAYKLNIGHCRKELRRKGQGQSVVHIYKSDIEKISLSLPPLPEQKRIVAVLETWDEYIEGLDRKIEIKKNIKKGLMQQLLTGKKRLKGFSGEWKKNILAKIGSFSKGADITKADLKESGCNAVRYGELYTDHDVYIKKIRSFISEEVAGKAKLISEGDILFAGSGETIDEIGKSAVYLFVEKCYAGGDIIVFTPRECDSIFLAYTLNMGGCRKAIRRIGQGQSVVHVYKKDLEKIAVDIPSVKEQQAIADILTKADDEIEALSKKKTLITAQKKYLLNNLIGGNIRTPENLLTRDQKHEKN